MVHPLMCSGTEVHKTKFLNRPTNPRVNMNDTTFETRLGLLQYVLMQVVIDP